MLSEHLIPLREVNNVVKKDLCIGCGFCKISLSNERLTSTNVSMKYDSSTSLFTPEVLEPDDQALVFCPGKTMPLRTLHENKFGMKSTSYLGATLKTFAGWQTNSDKRLAAASGGISSAIIEHLLSTGEVSKVYMAVNRGTKDGSYGEYTSEITRIAEGYDSIYHAVDFGRDLDELIKDTSKFVFVGLPCEIATIEALKNHDSEFRGRCVLTVGLFCGGVNRFEGVEWYIRKMAKSIGNITKVNYRNGFWPGAIRVESGENVSNIPRIMGNSRRNILKYIAAFQGPWMLKRCRICPDQVSHLADISLGDPHLAKYKGKNNLGVSAIVVRTDKGESVISELKSANKIEIEYLSEEEIIESQGYTLKNRTHADLYAQVATRLGLHSPSIETLTIDSSDSRYLEKIPMFALIDLLKIKYRKNKFLLLIISPIQLMEYLFVRFTPSEFMRKAKSLVSNKQ